MKKLTAVAVAAGVAVGVGVFAGPSPALAGACSRSNWDADVYSNRTIAYNFNRPTCASVNARVDRYYASSVYIYTSGWWYNMADTGAHNEGANAGNAGRAWDGNGSYPGWIWF